VENRTEVMQPCLKNAANFLVTRMYKMNFWVYFLHVFAYGKSFNLMHSCKKNTPRNSLYVFRQQGNLLQY